MRRFEIFIDWFDIENGIIVDFGCVFNRSLIKIKIVFVDKILYIFIIIIINNVYCVNG